MPQPEAQEPEGPDPEEQQRQAEQQAIIWDLLQESLQQQNAQGFDESEMFDELVDWLEDEFEENFADGLDDDAIDAALPVITGFAIRTLARPLARQAGGYLPRPARQRLVAGATEAARTLVASRGPAGVRALPRIARSVAQNVARQPGRPAPAAVAAATRAVQRRARQVAARPGID